MPSLEFYCPRHVTATMMGLIIASGSPMLASASVEPEACLAKEMALADDLATIGELRAKCAAPTTDAPSKDALGSASEIKILTEKNAEVQGLTANEGRLKLEEATDANPWVITAHKPNYLLPLDYNANPNQDPFVSEGEGDQIDHSEVKFQFSSKFPLVRSLFSTQADMYFAYTNRSFWQMYSTASSAAFRETNHEPEFFLTYPVDWSLFGWKNSSVALGVVHQSNGRDEPLSRSWNRLYASALFEQGNWGLSIKPWYRIPEEEKTDLSTTSGDDNPDIYKYMGYGEMRLSYHKQDHVITLMERNNFTSKSKGAVELAYSFPLYGKLKGYTQFFHGYGESLIDYNARSSRISMGVAISDWF